MALFFSCSSNDDDTFTGNESEETVTLLIAAPKSVTTRAVGDPGEAVTEGEDWDKLAVILAYTELVTDGVNSTPVRVETLTKKDFESLPIYLGTTYRQLRLNVPRGKVHIYGVTYSDGADKELEKAIQECNGSTDEDKVTALTISNDYASGDAGQTEKFLSVATGYYQDNSGGLAEYDISNKNPIYGELAPSIPSMRLVRLAANIDIQWDAQDAYTQGYTDVGVDGFTFYNTSDETETGKGMGCLFPELYTGTETFAGQSLFVNTSAVSKRNGRVYHYVFPSKGTPHVKFNLSATMDDAVRQDSYTFQFPGKIQKSTWYKVNTTIRGVTGTTTITLNN